jgi:hypothetical protein
MKAIYSRYHQAKRKEKTHILDEFCKVYGCHRKHAIRLLKGPPPSKQRPRRHLRKPLYGSRLISILQAVWKASGYLWSKRLKAALPLWLPWIRHRFQTSPQLERQLLSISPAQIDRRLKPVKHRLRRRIYGRTKPGTLLKHHIPIKTDAWDVRVPGFTEVDLVSHSGDCAEGDFAYTLDVTDIHTGWVERRAVLGKGQHAVLAAIQQIQEALPFKLLGIDCDNGSEFINAHLYRYCQGRAIQLTRGRPYKKDDNAHIEQKNWTHVRKLLGYVRYDTQEAVETMNDLYRNELRSFQNFFQPSVKLVKKVRIGSRLKRVYDAPQTPLERVLKSNESDPAQLAQLKKLQSQLDPFELSSAIDQKLEIIYRMASTQRVSRYARALLKPSEAFYESRRKSPQVKTPASALKAPICDPFQDLRFDPVLKLQRMWEREALLNTI